MVIDSYKVAEINEAKPKISDYSLDGSPDLVVYSIKLADYNADLSKNPRTLNAKISRFIDSAALNIGDTIDSTMMDPFSSDNKEITATITGVEFAVDEDHPNRIEKLYSVKTDLFKKPFTVYGDAEGGNVPRLGQKVHLTLYTRGQKVEVSADEFPDPVDEYTLIYR